MDRLRRRAIRPGFDRLDDRCLLTGMTLSQIGSAYGLGSIAFGTNGTIKGDGTGQTIAIIDAYHDPYLLSDLTAYDRANNLPTPSGLLNQVDLAGTQTDDGWAGEEALDVETAHALAPGARIVVVEARSDGVPDLLAAVDVARSMPAVSVVSMSWGGSETSGQAALDYHFTTPAGHQGITFLAASGDEGSGGGAEWPASSPNVIAVGGTSLRIGTNGAYAGESLWSGSSGGTSRVEAEPAYQRSTQSTGYRTTPDVAFDGDPNSGAYVYSTAPSTGRGGWQQVGGTSLGAPAWAAVVAIADQGRATIGRGTLDGATQTLPALYALPAADFHKVASLTTVTRSGGRRGFGSTQSTTVTAGLGTPNGAATVYGLIFGTTTSTAIKTAAQVATTTTTTTHTATTTTTTTTGSGQATAPTAPTGPTLGQRGPGGPLGFWFPGIGQAATGASHKSRLIATSADLTVYW